MRYAIEKIENYRGTGTYVWAVSDGETSIILDLPHNQFHLDMVELKFKHEKEKR